MPSTRRQVLAATAGVGVAGLAGCTAGRTSPYSPGTDDSTEWPMPDHDPRGSAYSPDAAIPRDGVSVRWETAIPTRPAGRPVVAADTVFLPTAAGLVAYDLADGSERWRVGEEQPWPTSPVVHDGVVYAGISDQPGPSLHALDVRDGTEVWTYDTRGDVWTAPVPDLDNDALRSLYVGDDTGRVYALDPSSGTVEHHTDVFGAVSQLAFDRRLFVGTEGGEIYSLYDTGERLQGLWRRKLDGKVTAIASHDGELFVATFGGPVYRLQDGAHAGRTSWTIDRGAIELAAASRDVVGSDGGGLGVYDDRTGESRWRKEGGYGAAPAVAGDLLVAGGGDLGEDGSGFVTAYGMRGDLTSGVLGRAKWTFETDSAVVEGVAVADGAVFAATQGAGGNPRLYALDPA